MICQEGRRKRGMDGGWPGDCWPETLLRKVIMMLTFDLTSIFLTCAGRSIWGGDGAVEI